MKKRLILVLGILILSSCTPFNNEKTLLGLINDLSLNLSFEVKMINNDKETKFKVNNLSYVEDDTTYYKYCYKDKYQKYNSNEVEENVDCVEYGRYFTSLINRVLYSSTNFEINQETYILKSSAYNKFDLSFFGENLSLFKVSKKDKDIVLINLEFNENKYTLEYSLNDIEIYPYQVNQDDYTTFYQKNMITFDEMINNEGDFVFVITSDDCSSCITSEKQYFLFSYEWDKKMFVLDKDSITTEQRKQILPSMVEAYSSQKDDFKHQSFSTYPDNRFLTPTSIRMVDKKVKYVYLGISKYDVNAFYDFSFN